MGTDRAPASAATACTPQALQGAERGPGGPRPQGAGGVAGAGVPAGHHLRGGEVRG